ncbi:MAG TPA: hypothetical protein VHL80_08790, partial [Polyangia bacterium]|nr:hypothetical protein [Polyangia bacterium]
MTARRMGALAAALAATAWSCDRLATNLAGGAGPEAGLLRGKLPVASRGVTHLKRLTDGIAAQPGDPPRTDLTSELKQGSSYVTWDLGADTPVRCVLIDADGDDAYTLSLSKDGKDFLVLYRAAPDEDRGLQLRAGRDLTVSGRYLLLSAAGGDGLWSVSEVSAWRDCPKSWPPLAMQKGTPDDEAVRLKLWAFAALALAYVLAYRKRMPDWAKLLGVAPAGVGIALAVQLAELWPPSPALAARLAGVA